MSTSRYWGIVGAAGLGTRMKSDIPKQYLSLNGKTVLEHTLERLLSYPLFEKIVVVLRPDDSHWPTLSISNHLQVLTTTGGLERCHSVLQGLYALREKANENDWVLVHDAVRPCIRHSDIHKLTTQLADHPVGGVLGAPLRNTIKQTTVDRCGVITLDRSRLWEVFTPQMFRYGTLYHALHTAIDNNQAVTDEASAMELMGAMPALVEGRRDNIKITEPADLRLAQFFLDFCDNHD